MTYGTANQKTHCDFVDVIGGTNATGRNRTERQWNAYYLRCYQDVVSDLLRGEGRGSVLDVGTSHGNWYSFLNSRGFKKIWGVEISPDRAAQASVHGYTKVFNCDAADVPLPPNSVDVAVSNDVFVHILQPSDKIRVVKKVEELLVPGGCLVFNHASALAFYGTPIFRIDHHCSYVSLDELIRLVHEHTGLRIVDMRPSYFHWRFVTPPRMLRVLRRIIALPVVPWVLAKVDRYWTSKRLGIEDSDYFYVKLEKPKDAAP